MKIFIADIILAGPLSILASIFLWKSNLWGLLLSWLVSGIYLYGSVVVYVMIIQNGPPYPLELIFPPIIGVGLSLILLFWTKSNVKQFIKLHDLD